MTTLPSHEFLRGLKSTKELNFPQLAEFMNVFQARVEWEIRVAGTLRKREDALTEEGPAMLGSLAAYAAELNAQSDPYMIKVETSQPGSAEVPDLDMANKVITFVDNPEATQALTKLCDHLAQKWSRVYPDKTSEYKAMTAKAVDKWSQDQVAGDAYRYSKDYPPNLHSAYKIVRQQHELTLLWIMARKQAECDVAFLIERKNSVIKSDGDVNNHLDEVIHYWESLEQIFYHRERALGMLEEMHSEVLRKKYPSEERQVARLQSWLKWCEMTLQQT